jgi:alpha-galactosidase
MWWRYTYMVKVTFVGAGSTVFVKNIVGDLFLDATVPPELGIALYDIDADRLEESRLVVQALNERYNNGRAVVDTFLGVPRRKDALAGADFVINTIQVGGYDPATIADFEIPKRYGLRQTIGDTLGIGGIFRGLRTIPVVLDIADEIESVAPRAIFLNYTNPMAIVTGALLHHTSVPTVGLCHSVQVCATHLLSDLGIEASDLRWRIAGINHMAWLLDIRDGDTDLYPEVKRRAAERNARAIESGEGHDDMVRYEIMRHFGYYVTESSEHNAEYTPFWIKSTAPEMIERYNIPLDEYPRRCVTQINEWAHQKESIISGTELDHQRSVEYAASIVGARVKDHPVRIHGNVLNRGLIPNLPDDAIVEVPIMVDGNGHNPVAVDPLPTQCAALNQTNINVQLLTIEAAMQRSRERVYQTALLDPHTAAELPPDRIVAMCDDLFDAHREWLPEYT